MSRIRGTQRIQEDTKGHGEVGGGVLEDTGGAAGIPEDTTLGRFGTVRPRVQIPGPRPICEFKSRCLGPARWRFWPGRSQGGHRPPRGS